MRFIINKLVIIISGFLILFSCKNNDEEPTPDPIPDQQQVVTIDSSGLTGELTVLAKYYDSNNQIHDAPSGTYVSLFASYEDLINGLSLYEISTTNNKAYFGYINYGNYYVTSYAGVDTNYYYGEAALQIRAGRKEELTITMY